MGRLGQKFTFDDAVGILGNINNGRFPSGLCCKRKELDAIGDPGGKKKKKKKKLTPGTVYPQPFHKSPFCPCAGPTTMAQHGPGAVLCLSELEDPSPAATALGVFSVLFSTLVGLPQAYKIYKLKSARGVSFMTLGLGNVGGFLYVLNLVILHYNQITLSLTKDFRFWLSAQRSLTFVWVELFNSFSMLCIYPVAAYYVKDEPYAFTWEALGINWVVGMKDAVRYGVYVQIVVIGLAWLPALAVFMSAGR